MILKVLIFIHSITMKIKPLKYPFTFEEWVNHPSNKKKLIQIKKTAEEMKQLELELL